jgi:hypothetical protein
MDPRTLSIHTDTIYSLNKIPEVDRVAASIYGKNPESVDSKKMLNKYSINSLVINNFLENNILGAEKYPSTPSLFLSKATDFGPRIYDNRMVSIWLI